MSKWIRIGTRNMTSHVFTRVRHSIIRLLAGKRAIVINCEIDQLILKSESENLIFGCTLNSGSVIRMRSANGDLKLLLGILEKRT